MDQHGRLYGMKLDDMRRRQDLERKRLPKIQRNDMKNRSNNLRRQLRLERKRDSLIIGFSADEKSKIKEVSDGSAKIFAY